MSFDATLRRAFDTRLVGASLVAAVVLAPSPTWQRASPLPVPRTEVAAASNSGGIGVVGGFLANGDATARFDTYFPRTDSWVRGDDLPLAVHHAMAAAKDGLIAFFVVGGYSRERSPLRNAYSYTDTGWEALPPLPAPRAAGGAAILGRTLYVVGGVGPNGLARTGFAFALDRAPRWRTIPGPTPREHLAVVAHRGRLFAIGGRTAGLNTNVRTFETWKPGERRWRRLARLPRAAGGTGAAAVGDWILSVGGERPTGTIRTVYGFNLKTRRWRRFADLPSPRHGLGVVAVGNRVYAIGGGPQPGLTVSGANEYLTLP